MIYLRKCNLRGISREKLQEVLSHQMSYDIVQDRYDRYDVCGACNTSAGSAKHQRFTCASCGKLSQWYDGADDDRPMDCSEYWGVWISQGGTR